MDHKTLISTLAKRCGCSVEEATDRTAKLADIISQCVTERSSVAVPAFGTFTPVKTNEHIAPDPETGVPTLYPPTIVLEFTPSSTLKNHLNNERR